MAIHNNGKRKHNNSTISTSSVYISFFQLELSRIPDFSHGKQRYRSRESGQNKPVTITAIGKNECKQMARIIKISEGLISIKKWWAIIVLVKNCR